MTTQEIKSFNVIGISVRTTNENGQAGKDIQELWAKFMTDNILAKIPNKISTAVYSIYTDYELDYTKPYTTILGCEVKDLSEIPEGMVGNKIETTQYQKFLAQGNLMQGIVYNEWEKIWNMDLNRAYTADFEVYDEKSQNPENAVVEIFIAMK
ncbi:GyrI-like domain-containing protein [Pedobacter fastidiosus]|uniref:Effector binding domain-containing protein n=1 Tax=Pedobacter fastidiosus TaxID=2765361 RepID=A0ABR7KQV3_9SPHI|nr:GyrI-like domain-containing protein [Pedobacter fastidiosus]MBC6110225.1 effector binding domain-containing protein [Pedobacter fastidiosus]